MRFLKAVIAIQRVVNIVTLESSGNKRVSGHSIDDPTSFNRHVKNTKRDESIVK